jgi:hypothetical protein
VVSGLQEAYVGDSKLSPVSAMTSVRGFEGDNGGKASVVGADGEEDGEGTCLGAGSGCQHGTTH